jgi:hypothetical protein
MPSSSSGAGGAGGGTGGGGGSCPPAPIRKNTGGPPTWSFGIFGDAANVGGVAVTPTGDVIIFGSFVGSLNAGSMLVSQGASDLFLVDLDASGNEVWSEAFPNPSGESTAGPIAVDAHGNIILSASFSGSLGFGVDTSDAGIWLDGPSALALATVDAKGNVLWAQAHGTNAFPDSLALDASGNIFVTAETGPQGTVAKFDAMGNHVWSEHLGSQVGFVAVDASGEPVVAEGFTSGTVGVEKFDAQGASLWTQTFTPSDGSYTGSSGFVVSGVAVSPDGTITVTGALRGAGISSAADLSATHASDAAFFTLDGTGKPLNARVFPSVAMPSTESLIGAGVGTAAFAAAGRVFLSTLTCYGFPNLGKPASAVSIGILELDADGGVASDRTSGGWMVDADGYGSAASAVGVANPVVGLAADAQGGVVIAWGPHRDPCAPPLDLGPDVTNSASTTSIVVARFAP